MRFTYRSRRLQTFPYFPHHKLTAWQNLLGLIQAETNFALSGAIHQRAETTALYFDRLCAHRERELADPDDVLFEAEYRKQELADQEKLTEEKPAQSKPTREDSIP